jgi:hypothetical protein
MMFVWIALGIAVVAALAKLVSAWNGPRVAEADAEKAAKVQEERTERLRLRKEAREKRRGRHGGEEKPHEGA